MNGVLVVIVVVDVLLVVVVVTAGGGQSWWLMVVMVVVAGGGGGGGVVVWWLVSGSGSDDFQSQTHKQNDAHPSNQIRWPWACSFPITIWLTNQCTSKPPNPLALDLLISKQDLCFWDPCLDLVITSHLSWTKQFGSKLPKLLAWIWPFPIKSSWRKQCRSMLSNPLALDLLISYHIPLQTNTDRSLETHWPWTCSFPIASPWTKEHRSKPRNPLALNLLKTITFH